MVLLLAIISPLRTLRFLPGIYGMTESLLICGDQIMRADLIFLKHFISISEKNTY